MLNTDANTLQGLAQLSPSVRALLENELLLALDRLCDAVEPAIFYRLQGRAQFLKELLNLVESTEAPRRSPSPQTLRRA
jgi:hypothetical protein